MFQPSFFNKTKTKQFETKTVDEKVSGLNWNDETLLNHLVFLKPLNSLNLQLETSQERKRIKCKSFKENYYYCNNVYQANFDALMIMHAVHQWVWIPRQLNYNKCLKFLNSIFLKKAQN
jgi:hypothetical protein